MNNKYNIKRNGTMKNLAIVIGLLPVISFADTSNVMQAQMNKELEQAGLPTHGSGIHVVPENTRIMAQWQRDKFKANLQEMAQKGYIDQTSDRAYELMHFKDQVKSKGYSDSTANEGDSGLHKIASEIPFSYTYIGVPQSAVTEMYGIAPAGAFVMSPQRGWTGAVAFFKASFAHCAYTEKNIIPGQGGVQVEESVARYDVNHKLTVVEVEGNANSGFLYNISWFDLNYYRQLECATPEFSQKIKAEVIALANRIDSN